MHNPTSGSLGFGSSGTITIFVGRASTSVVGSRDDNDEIPGFVEISTSAGASLRENSARVCSSLETTDVTTEVGLAIKSRDNGSLVGRCDASPESSVRHAFSRSAAPTVDDDIHDDVVDDDVVNNDVVDDDIAGDDVIGNDDVVDDDVTTAPTSSGSDVVARRCFPLQVYVK